MSDSPNLIRSPHRWKVLAVGVAANTAFSAVAAGLPTTAVFMRAGYLLDNDQLALALGLLGLGVALFELPWGLLTDRWGDRPVLLAGLGSTAAALAWMSGWAAPADGAVPSLALLAVGLVLVGMLGGGLGALLLPWLAASAGFGVVFGVLALMCGTATLLAACWLRVPDSADAPVAARPAVGSPLKDARVWRAALAIGIMCGPQFAVLTFATVFLHDAFHARLAVLTAVMVAVQLGAMAARIASGRWTDRRGNRRAYLRGCAVLSFGLYAALAAAAWHAGASPNAWHVHALALLLAAAGICASAWHGVAYTELATLAGASRAGTALGMANSCVYLMLFATPLAIAHIVAAGSWPLAWLLAGTCMLAALPLLPRAGARAAVDAATRGIPCAATTGKP